MRWSTDQLPPSERFEQWREVACATFFRLTPEQHRSAEPFRATISSHPLGTGAVTTIESVGQHVDRTDDDIADDPTDSICFNVQLHGSGSAAQRGRHGILGPGQACLVTTSEPFTLQFKDDFGQTAVHLPRSLIGPNLPEGEVVAEPLPASPLTHLAIRYAAIAGETPLSSGSAAYLAQHLSEIIAAILTRQSDQPASPARRALLQAALTLIEEELADPQLSPGRAARRLSVSERTLHTAFAGHTRTFSAEVLHQRVWRARRYLLDPARWHLRIVDVAVECGFNDRSHFHRTFRAAFGQPPGEYRRLHRA